MIFSVCWCIYIEATLQSFLLLCKESGSLTWKAWFKAGSSCLLVITPLWWRLDFLPCVKGSGKWTKSRGGKSNKQCRREPKIGLVWQKKASCVFVLCSKRKLTLFSYCEVHSGSFPASDISGCCSRTHLTQHWMLKKKKQACFWFRFPPDSLPLSSENCRFFHIVARDPAPVTSDDPPP